MASELLSYKPHRRQQQQPQPSKAIVFSNRSVLRSSRVFLRPLRFSSGVKYRVLQLSTSRVAKKQRVTNSASVHMNGDTATSGSIAHLFSCNGGGKNEHPAIKLPNNLHKASAIRYDTSTGVVLAKLRQENGATKPKQISLVAYSDSEDSDEDELSKTNTITAIPDLADEAGDADYAKTPSSAALKAEMRPSMNESNTSVTNGSSNGISSPFKPVMKNTSSAPNLTTATSNDIDATDGIVYGPQLPQKTNGFASVDKPSTSADFEVNDRRLSLVSFTKKEKASAFGLSTSSSDKENERDRAGQSTSLARYGETTQKSAFKRPNEMNGCGPVAQRRRLLSEAGEEARMHPIIDRTVIRHWRWTSSNLIGTRSRACGLHNYSNDCFLNSCLQILVHTAPVAKLIESHGIGKINCQNACLMCVLQRYVTTAFSSVNPVNCPISRYMQGILKTHVRGNQEDAHEVMLNLLDKLDMIVFPGFKSLPPLRGAKPDLVSGKASKTMPSEQIFGMTIRYKGSCSNCNKESNSYDRSRYLELKLDRWRPATLKELLERYFRPDKIHDYKCEKCGVRNTFVRVPQILRPPAILMLQIARFINMEKARFPVEIKNTIDLSEFLVDPEQHSDSKYVLHGIIDHLGYTLNSGHYRAFHVDVFGDKWYQFDDADVTQISREAVLRQAATGCYLLVYHRRDC